MHSRVTRRRVPYRGCRFIPLLSPSFSRDVNLCSDSHAIAFGPHKLQKNPVISGIRDVAKKLDRSVENAHHSVDVSIIKQISKCSPAMWSFELEIGPCHSANIDKFPIAQIAKN